MPEPLPATSAAELPDAEAGWRFWRGVLEQPERLLGLRRVAAGEDPIGAGFSAAELPFVIHHAAHLQQTELFVTTYRYRLTRSVPRVLHTVAPLSWRTLSQAGFNLEDYGEAFHARTGWRDEGPRTYACGARLLEDLERHAPALPWLREVMALEREGIALVRRLAASDEGAWQTLRQAPEPEAPLRANPAAALHRSAARLDRVMLDRGLLGRSPVEAGETWWLLFLPRPELHLQLVALSPTAAAIWQLLADAGERGCRLSPAQRAEAAVLLRCGAVLAAAGG